MSEISAAYESGWNKLTEKYYAKTEWPDAELIAPLVNDGRCFELLMLQTFDIYLYLLYRSSFFDLIPRVVLSVSSVLAHILANVS